ncbi:MAG: class I SAM-dependent methyltransferase [Candidatus Aminicenantes bacterium]|nr:class I SAM-dependent methyltransferase [Candidatus Aminicenantes bacterium]
MKHRLWLFLFMIPASLCGQISLQERPFDVPYVPTKPEVVAAMLRMAQVTKNDVLYDLGCGDGRIVITAAQLYGTRGIGIDIDPERIRESRENAAAAKVDHLVKFIEQDLFESDFHEASVVSLYLLTSVNLRLRPILLRQLRPGTRIVSHNYAMDTWKPDDSTVVMINDQSHSVYFWVVPANISGIWKGAWADGGQATDFSLKMEQHFQWPTGTMILGGKEIWLSGIRLSGDRFEFTAKSEEDASLPRLVFTARASGDEMKGSVEIIRPDGRSTRRSWKAKRELRSAKALDAEEWEESPGPPHLGSLSPTIGSCPPLGLGRLRIP